MGCDIQGWVEIGRGNERHRFWEGAIDVSALIPRDYDSYACLFGVRNYARFAPIAPDRGLPTDLSYAAKREFMSKNDDELYLVPHEAIIQGFRESGYHNPSWLSLAEIQAIDLDEKAAGVDERIKKYRRSADGTLTLVSKSAWDADFGRAARIDAKQILGAHATGGPGPDWEEGQTWEYGDFVFKAERHTRREALRSWELLLQMMMMLGQRYGVENVRVVVWFSS